MGWLSKAEDFFLATIVPSGEGARIQTFLGVVNGEAIIGANVLRDMFSSVRDIVGGRAAPEREVDSLVRTTASSRIFTRSASKNTTGYIGSRGRLCRGGDLDDSL